MKNSNFYHPKKESVVGLILKAIGLGLALGFALTGWGLLIIGLMCL